MSGQREGLYPVVIYYGSTFYSLRIVANSQISTQLLGSAEALALVLIYSVEIKNLHATHESRNENLLGLLLPYVNVRYGFIAFIVFKWPG